MENRQLGALCGSSDEQVGNRDLAVMKRAARSEELEQVEGAPPDSITHRRRAESVEVIATHGELSGVPCLHKELELHHVAGRDLPAPERTVESDA